MNIYKAGVLILGSLLWDNSKGRKAWREHYFGENFYPHIIDVKVPVRYGRFSRDRKCPTITLSSEFWEEERYGTAKFIPFRNQKKQVSELICAARDLSEAENSSDRKFVKGYNEWCILTCWLNSRMKEKKKDSFISRWSEKYGQELTTEFLDNFKMESEDESLINENGCLKIEYPKPLHKFDLVLATQTKPRKKPKDQSEYLKPNELTSQIFKKPEYFIKNTLNGIITSEDDSIIEILKNNELAIFKVNALKDGCTESEVDAFIQSFIK